MLVQCVAVCCSVLQCVAVCCSVLQYVATCCIMLQCVAVCCSTIQYIAVSRVTRTKERTRTQTASVRQDGHGALIKAAHCRFTAVACVTRETATHCNILQHTATHSNTIQHTATQYTTLHHTAIERTRTQAASVRQDGQGALIKAAHCRFAAVARIEARRTPAPRLARAQHLAIHTSLPARPALQHTTRLWVRGHRELYTSRRRCVDCIHLDDVCIHLDVDVCSVYI